MVGHYGVKEGVDPLPRLSTDTLLNDIQEIVADIEDGHDAMGEPISNTAPYLTMLETQMCSLCIRVDKLLGVK